MPRLAGVARWLALAVFQLFVFVAAAGACGWLVSHWQADRYVAGEEPRRMLPVVARSAAGYRLLTWGELADAREADPALEFRLTEPAGHFELPPEGGFVPRVAFEVIEQADGWQRVEVDWADDDYHTVSRYRTDGDVVVPGYFRIWGAASVMLGIPPAIVIAWLPAFVLRRWRARQSG